MLKKNPVYILSLILNFQRKVNSPFATIKCFAA